MRGHPSHPAYPGLVSRAYIGAYHPYQTWPPKMMATYICPYHNLIAPEHEEIMPLASTTNYTYYYSIRIFPSVKLCTSVPQHKTAANMYL